MKLKLVIALASLLLSIPVVAQRQDRQQSRQQSTQRQAQPRQSQRQQAQPQQRQHQSQQRQTDQRNQTRQRSDRLVQHQQQSQRQGRYAQNGQRDRRGHEYNSSRFGSYNRHRFSAGEGRDWHGRHEFSFGGYWFYAGFYPSWFYECDSYLIMDPYGNWYVVSSCDPSLRFEVETD